MKIISCLIALLLAAAIPCDARPDDADRFELKPNLVVTPSKTLQARSEPLAAISVITREEIELSLAEDLFDLLRLQPGIDIVRSGGPGSQTSVFLRGSNSNHVLVLIDGVRVSSSNTGAYTWEQLPLNQIERVEIVRGPRSSLYGSDSIGGVIQVFTRSAPRPYARISVGSFDSQEAEAGWGFEGHSMRLSLNAGFRDTDGFSAQNPAGFSFHPDPDGFRSANLGIRGSKRSSYGRWEFSALVLDNESEFDQGVSGTQQFLGSVALDGGLSRNWDYRLQAGYVDEELASDFGFFTTLFQSDRLELSWSNQIHGRAGGHWGFGLDWYSEDGRQAGGWNRTRHNSGIYAAYQRDIEALRFEIGGRLDENSRFGSEVTGQAAVGYEPTGSLTIRAGYGTAFRGPNFSEQFSPGFGGLFAGNPDLEPESAQSSELGLDWRPTDVDTLSASIYRTDTDELIAFAGPFFRAINIAEARQEGIELEYRHSGAVWQLKLNATVQNAEDRTTGETLLRRPDEKGSITLDRRFADGSWIGAEWFVSGSRADFGGIRLDGYNLLNLRMGWAFGPALRGELRVQNVFDEDYEPAFGFNAAGRSVFVSLSWLP